MSIPSRTTPLYDCVSLSSLPVWCGFSAKKDSRHNRLTSWHDDTIAFEENVKSAAAYDFDVLGIMHTSVDLISECISVIKRFHTGPLMAYPDSGYFKAPNWQFQDIISPQELLAFARLWRAEGVSIFGGCCGLGPEHPSQLKLLKST